MFKLYKSYKNPKLNDILFEGSRYFYENQYASPDNLFDQDSSALVKIINNDNAGVIFFKKNQDFIWISFIYIKEEYRGIGVYTDLMKKIKFIAKNKKCNRILLGCHQNNETAKNLYNKSMNMIAENNGYYIFEEKV